MFFVGAIYRRDAYLAWHDAEAAAVMAANLQTSAMVMIVVGKGKSLSIRKGGGNVASVAQLVGRDGH